MRSSALLALFAPLVLASPMGLYARNKTQSCVSRSPSITKWELEDFDFHASYVFSTPAHQNSRGYISFTAINPVHNTKTKCSASSNRLSDFFHGEIEYECETDDEEPTLGDATFTFDRPSGEIKFEQTWYCIDNPRHARFTAKGDAIAELDCEETFWENENWSMGEVYSRRNITCDLTDLAVPVKELTGVAR